MAGKRKRAGLAGEAARALLRRSKRGKLTASDGDRALEASKDNSEAVAQGEGEDEKWSTSAYETGEVASRLKKAANGKASKQTSDQKQVTGDLDDDPDSDPEDGAKSSLGEDVAPADAPLLPPGDPLPPIGDADPAEDVPLGEDVPRADAAPHSPNSGQANNQHQPNGEDDPEGEPPAPVDGSKRAAGFNNEIIKSQALLIELLERSETITSMIHEGRQRCVQAKEGLQEIGKSGLLVTRTGRKAAETAAESIEGFETEMLDTELVKRKKVLGTLKSTLRGLVGKLTIEKDVREGNLQADTSVDDGDKLFLNDCSLACESSNEITDQKVRSYGKYLEMIEDQLQEVDRYVRHQMTKAFYPPDNGPLPNRYWDDDEGDDEQAPDDPEATPDSSDVGKHATNDAESTPESSDVDKDDANNIKATLENDGNDNDSDDHDDHDNDKDEDEEAGGLATSNIETNPEVSHNECIHKRALVPESRENAFLRHFNKKYNTEELDISNKIDAPVETILLYVAAQYHEHKIDKEEPTAEDDLEEYRNDLHEAATEAKLQNYEVDIFLRSPGPKDEVYIIKALGEYGDGAPGESKKVLKSRKTLFQAYVKTTNFGHRTLVHYQRLRKCLEKVEAARQQYAGMQNWARTKLGQTGGDHTLRPICQPPYMGELQHHLMYNRSKLAHFHKLAVTDTQQAQKSADQRLQAAMADARSQGFTVRDDNQLQLFTRVRHELEPGHKELKSFKRTRIELGLGQAEEVNRVRYYFTKVSEMPNDIYKAAEIRLFTAMYASDNLSQAWKAHVQAKKARNPTPKISSIKASGRSSVLSRGKSTLCDEPAMSSSEADEACVRRKYKQQFLEHTRRFSDALEVSGKRYLDPEQRFGDPSKPSGERELERAQRYEGCLCPYCKVLERHPTLIDVELRDRISPICHTLAGILNPRDDEEGLGLRTQST